jgi:pyrimidine operon attenuation protein/uracil phosphoribosyltransferase
MQILQHQQIEQIVKRLAIEILEQNIEEKEIFLAGINNNGMHFAQMLMNELLFISDIKFTLTRIIISPAAPLENEILLEIPAEKLKNKVLIIVDDVANTGRTLFYAFQPLLDTILKKVEIAVLVNRMHKSFPISVDYKGIELATTLLQDIKVVFSDKKEKNTANVL